jgi:hypothetical protein
MALAGNFPGNTAIGGFRPVLSTGRLINSGFHADLGQIVGGDSVLHQQGD